MNMNDGQADIKVRFQNNHKVFKPCYKNGRKFVNVSMVCQCVAQHKMLETILAHH